MRALKGFWTLGLIFHVGRADRRTHQPMPASHSITPPNTTHCAIVWGMALAPLNPRKVLVVYSREANGDWRSNAITIVQGGVATIVTGTSTDLDTRKAAVYAANPVQTILEEEVLDVSIA